MPSINGLMQTSFVFLIETVSAANEAGRLWIRFFYR